MDKFCARSFMDDQMYIDSTAAQPTKVMEGKDGLPAEARRSVLGDNADA